MINPKFRVPGDRVGWRGNSHVLGPAEREGDPRNVLSAERIVSSMKLLDKRSLAADGIHELQSSCTTSRSRTPTCGRFRW